MSLLLNKKVLFGLLLVIALIAGMLFTVDETEIAIVTRFGKPMRVLTEPGLNFKLPLPFEFVMRYDKRLLVHEQLPTEFLTQDIKNILVQSFATWKIEDPRKFIQTVKNREGAEQRLSDTIRSELGSALGTVPLAALISTDPEQVKIDEIMKTVTAHCAEKTRSNYGIAIGEVSLKRINFPDQNKASVYERMRSERQRIAKKYRAEGKEQATKIKAETDKMVSKILSEAYRESETLKGEGDAQAAKIYTEAYNKDPGFYKMTRTLEAYKKVLDGDTTLVLSSDSELLELLGKGIK